MKWSIKIGRFAGIDVFMHFTFILFVAWVALAHWQQSRSLTATLIGAVFILAIFVCVVLHEFGHALTARRYGIQARDIILLPIGGLARLKKLPRRPFQEFWVALAGPAVNGVIAVALFVWLKLTASWEPLQSLTVTTGPFFERLLAVNLFMIAFNMIPAFPMDGGRVLRALLATRKEYGEATRIAASIGKGIAVIFGLVGLLYNPLLLFIAIFVWIGATQEAGMAQLKSAIGGVQVHQTMVSDFKTLSTEDSLNRAAELTWTSAQKDFPVLNKGIFEGMLRKTDLMVALSHHEVPATVASVARRDVVTVEASDMLDAVIDMLNECECHTLPVTKDGKLVGLVTRDNLGDFMRIHAAANNEL